MKKWLSMVLAIVLLLVVAPVPKLVAQSAAVVLHCEVGKEVVDAGIERFSSRLEGVIWHQVPDGEVDPEQRAFLQGFCQGRYEVGIVTVRTDYCVRDAVGYHWAQPSFDTACNRVCTGCPDSTWGSGCLMGSCFAGWWGDISGCLAVGGGKSVVPPSLLPPIGIE